MPTLLRAAALAAAVALAACGSGNAADLAAAEAASDIDPALTSALEDQILTDPNLVQQAHPNAVRPPEYPVQAQYPPQASLQFASATAASAASAASSDGPLPAEAGGRCGGAEGFDYGPQWADRLPAEFPAYPDGRVTEAAGKDSGECRIRVVTFRTADPYARVLDWYRAAAARGGFSAEHQMRGGDHVLGGVNERTDGAFYLIVTPVEGGSEVALIVNNGR